MSKLALSLAIGDYDRVRPLMDGLVHIDGVEPTFLSLVPEEIFFGAFAGRPARQFLETLELTRVLDAPARWVGRLCRRFQFNEGARWCALPHESDIRPAHALIQKFRNDGQPCGDW